MRFAPAASGSSSTPDDHSRLRPLRQPAAPQSRFCPRCGRPVAAAAELTGALRGGDYRIVRSISKGGMGAVYLARDRARL